MHSLSILPLFSGQQVNIRVGKGKQYSVSKSMLCAESSYFTAMFEKGFSEKGATSVTLEPIDGVVSERSLEALFQWLYTRRVYIDISDKVLRVSAIIEFARLADICGVTGMEEELAGVIETLVDGQVDIIDEETDALAASKYTECLVNAHIASAAKLPTGHAVRCLLTRAAADEFLGTLSPVLAKGIPELAADLLEQIGIALGGIEIVNKRSYVNSLVFPAYRIRIRPHPFDVEW